MIKPKVSYTHTHTHVLHCTVVSSSSSIEMFRVRFPSTEPVGKSFTCVPVDPAGSKYRVSAGVVSHFPGRLKDEVSSLPRSRCVDIYLFDLTQIRAAGHALMSATGR